MCVIYVADKNVRPTDEMLTLGAARNPAGGGAAWRKDGTVHFTKGLSLDEMKKINATLPFPYVLHFRWPSKNTAIGPEACHPFVVNEEVSFAVKGVAPNGVLFHNGLWTDWKNKLIDTAIRGRWPLPGGPWTDTRGLAWMLHHVGPGYLEFIDQKVIWFTKNSIELFGEGWKEVDSVLCSNLEWQETGGRRECVGFHPDGSTTKHEAKSEVKSEKTGGSSQQETFRARGANGAGSITSSEAPTRGAIKEEVQQSDEEAIRARMAKQPSSLILPCNRCKEEEARVESISADNVSEDICWTCWRKQLLFSRNAGAYVDQGKYKLVGICQYCWAADAFFVTVNRRRLICNVCHIKQDKPETTLLHQDDPRATLRENK